MWKDATVLNKQRRGAPGVSEFYFSVGLKGIVTQLNGFLDSHCGIVI